MPARVGARGPPVEVTLFCGDGTCIDEACLLGVFEPSRRTEHKQIVSFFTLDPGSGDQQAVSGLVCTSAITPPTHRETHTPHTSCALAWLSFPSFRACPLPSSVPFHPFPPIRKESQNLCPLLLRLCITATCSRCPACPGTVGHPSWCTACLGGGRRPIAGPAPLRPPGTGEYRSTGPRRSQRS